uniref:Uncharacterized protein n=1 Tax=Scophthalmus maximus TaxID=52904 RepID=A0A8D3BZI0_SCOMX
ANESYQTIINGKSRLSLLEEETGGGKRNFCGIPRGHSRFKCGGKCVTSCVRSRQNKRGETRLALSRERIPLQKPKSHTLIDIGPPKYKVGSLSGSTHKWNGFFYFSSKFPNCFPQQQATNLRSERLRVVEHVYEPNQRR